MPYTPILATLGYVKSPDGRRVLMIHRNARNDDHHLGKYNGLGGKLEANEDVAAGMRREIREEAGIECGAVAYLASQPWPFPASLMIGCIAQATTRELHVDGIELEDARWFSRDEAASMLQGRHPGKLQAPHPMAIAHHILRAWVQG